MQPRRDASPTPVRITLIGKPGCHLCDDARAVIARVAADLRVGWEERPSPTTPSSRAAYWEQIPVTLVDGASTTTGGSTRPAARRARAPRRRADGSAVTSLTYQTSSACCATLCMRSQTRTWRCPCAPVPHARSGLFFDERSR